MPYGAALIRPTQARMSARLRRPDKAFTPPSGKQQLRNADEFLRL